MAKITSRLQLDVGTELIVDEPNLEIELLDAGNLVPKDGVEERALYSKLVDLWTTAEYQDSPFPMRVIDPLSGQYAIGIDAGGNANGWKLKNEFTRNVLRGGGLTSYNASGDIVRIDAGAIGLGGINAGAQAYYTLDPADAPTDFAYDDMPDQLVQVFGDAANGNFDKRNFFKVFVREEGFKYAESDLSDTGKDVTGSGAFIVNFLLNNELDDAITESFANINQAPYTGVEPTFFSSPQDRTVNGVTRQYDIIVSNTEGATLEQIHTKLQYLLTQSSNINAGGSPSVLGKTAALFGVFQGDKYITNTGVYVDDVLPADSNRITYTDTTGVGREDAFEAGGLLRFNSLLVNPGSRYRLLYTTVPGPGNDYGEAGATTVKDADGNEIAGEITSGEIPFTFDYDNDTEGGPAGTDKPVTLIGIAPGFAQFAVDVGTLTKSKNITVSITGQSDPGYQA